MPPPDTDTDAKVETGPQWGFGLYVHWPYCAKICPYCDFNVYAAKSHDTSPLVAAIRRDVARHRDILPDHPPLDSLFFGGGTPSLLGLHDIAVIIKTAGDAFGLKPGCEITIEANPNDILRADLRGWAHAGINRVSIGLQSLDDTALHFLGRDHDSAAGRRSVSAVQAVFDNHSVDLIYARPGQLIKDWQRELAEALTLGMPHLSLYELTIAERTAFGHRAARGQLTPMPDDDQADLYEATQVLCEAGGLPAYEVSNHARSPAFQSVHNSIYWRGGDWIGVGPGAHGRLTLGTARLATEATRRPDDYIAVPCALEARQTPLENAYELLAMGLRPATGIDITRIERLACQTLDSSLVAGFIAQGLAALDGECLRLTPAGRLLADHIAKKLAP